LVTFIAQRTRRRFRRGHSPFAFASLSIGIPARFAAAGALPPLNRELRRRFGQRGKWIVAALAAPALLSTVLALHATLPIHHAARQPADTLAAESLQAALEAAVTGIDRAPVLAGFPGGIVSTTAITSSVPQYAAALAGDLWVLNDLVYQWKTLTQSEALLPAPPVRQGPSLTDLLQAQARLTTAQLGLLALQQHATDAQIAAARANIAQAQAAVQAARQSAATATALARVSAPVGTQNSAAVATAQLDVANAQATLQRIQQPYSDTQIAAAQADLERKQQALNNAKAEAATAPAPVVTAAAAAPGRVERQIAVAPSVLAAAVPSDSGPAVRAAPQPAATLPPDVATPADPERAALSAPVTSIEDPEHAALAAPAAVVAAAATGSSATAAAGAALTAATSIDLLPAATSVAAPIPPPVAPAAAASDRPPAQAMPASGIGSTATATIAGLELQVAEAQHTVALYTAAPDPAALLQARDALTAAQQRLAAAQTPPPSPTAAPAMTAGASAPDAVDPTSVDASPEVQQAQQQYQQAVQALQMLSASVDSSATAAAQADLQAAQADYLTLLNQADAATRSQLGPGPLGGLASGVNYSVVGTTGPLTGGFIWPASGPISQIFGVPELGVGTPHTGIDIAQGLGLPVHAAASGVVSFSGGNPCCDFGYYVDILHPNGYLTRYGHLLVPSPLKVGDAVTQGQMIGLSGSTGFSTGPHVHFEVQLNGVPVDPLRVLSGVLPIFRP
jgi:murein DD-endopeptidase MepM/ murein hydrolase activator NlpD